MSWLYNIFQKKQHHYYARVNEDLVCTSVWCFKEQVNSAETVPVNNLDITLIGKIWDGNEWQSPLH